MAATAADVQESLDLDGGIRRYGADTYYGGGAWPLLTAWLGWYRSSTGDRSVRNGAPPGWSTAYDGAGHLPEQVGGEHRDPELVPHLGRPLGPPGGRPRRGRTPCTSSCGTNYRGSRPSRLRESLHDPEPLPDPSTKPAGSRPAAGGDHLAARAGAPNPPKQASQGTLDQRGALERKKGAEVKATNRKANRKRPAFRASLLAGACAVATITGFAGTGVASASSTVNLQFWNAYNATDKEASTMANVVLPQFEKENPGIKVTSVVIPYSELLQKYVAAVGRRRPSRGDALRHHLGP